MCDMSYLHGMVKMIGSVLQVMGEDNSVVAAWIYLEANGLLSSNQFGFQKRSVEDQLFLTYVEIVNRVDSGSIVDMIFQKHLMLRTTPLSYVIEAWCWGTLHLLAHDLLVGYTMCIRVAGETMNSKVATSGVPQGSVLGPVLFLIAASLGCCWKHLWQFKLYLSFPRDSCISVFQGMMKLQRFRFSVLYC